jgi:hypothetical protein
VVRPFGFPPGSKSREVGYLKERAANSIAVANAHFVVGQTLNREIFAELPEGEVATAELMFPILVGINLVDQNCSMLTTMTGEIALAIAINIESSNQAPALHWLFPDARVYCLTPP